MHLVENQQIGPYRLRRRLGKGNGGEVWLADDSSHGREVAVKFPLSEGSERNTILQEAVLWAKASHHPNILPVFGVEIHEGQLMIISEYAPEGTLRDWLKKRPQNIAPFPDPALNVIAGILAGLIHLESLGIVHRDLKPENIAMTGDTPRLMDFGLARAQAADVYVSQAQGTPLYMAPEAFNGVRSRWTDQWSAAVIFYELLTGKAPFPSTGDIYALMSAIKQATPAPLPSPLPINLRQAIFRALEKKPERRFPTAAEMQNALALKKEEDEAKPPTASGVSRRVLLYGSLMGVGGLATAGVMNLLKKTEVTTSPSPIPATPVPYLDPALARSLAPTSPAPKTLKEYRAQLVLLPSGTLLMGSNSGNADEKPVHNVQLSSFAIGRTPVTVAMWKEFYEATRQPMPSAPAWGWKDEHPIVNVSWEDCTAYADWAGLKLPTEAQWEYAARGGSATRHAYPWPGGFNEKNLWCSVAVARTETAPVSRSENIYVNGYGLVDLVGNVWEWCADWYGPYLLGENVLRYIDPSGPPTGKARVLRGGSWNGNSTGEWYRTADRSGNDPGSRGTQGGSGFRLAA